MSFDKYSCKAECRRKPAAHKGKVIFIDALNEVTRERAQSFLKPEHQQRILQAFNAFVDEPGLAKLASMAEVVANAGNLSIPLYVKRVAAAPALGSDGQAVTLRSAWEEWQADGRPFWHVRNRGLCRQPKELRPFPGLPSRPRM